MKAVMQGDGFRDATVCAWCPDYDPKTHPDASHGMCDTCAQRALDALDAAVAADIREQSRCGFNPFGHED